jgi:arylsulfatase
MNGDVRNIVLLSIDALRADHLSCYGYDRNTTPFFDGMAERNTRFVNAFSASSHTREAVPAILTGKYPNEAVNDGYRLAADSLATRLPDDFCSGGFHSNPFISRAYGFGAGFDAFDDDLYLGRHRAIALVQRALDKVRNRHYARADAINGRSLRWLDSLDADEPFFCWNHYMDVHGPYEPPPEYRESLQTPISDRDAQRLYKRAIRTPDSITDDERRTIIELYDREIRYVDGCIESFVSELDDRGLLDETLIVITADHGDAFGEHGYYEHPRYLDDELLHVPMLVCGPSVPAREVRTPVSTLDVAPTLLAAVGHVSDDLPGRSLFDVSEYENRYVFASARGEGGDVDVGRYAVRSLRSKYVAEYHLKRNETISEDVSDMGDGSGPAWKLPGETGREDSLVAMREALFGEVPMTVELTHGDDADTNGAVEARLSALGYRE